MSFPLSMKQADFEKSMRCQSFEGRPELAEQWSIYNNLPDGTAKMMFAEGCVNRWNESLNACAPKVPDPAGRPKGLYEVIPRGEPHPLDGKPADGGNRKGVGKVKMNLVFHDMAEALHEVCKVMTFGAEKHEPKGWVNVPDGIYEYTEALHRHINAESRGELRDKEWDLLHAAHAACCALIRTQLIINELKANGGVLPDGVVVKPMSEAVRKNIEGMMVTDEHPLRFKVGPGDPAAFKPVPVTEHLVQWKPQAATDVADKKVYYVKHYEFLPGQVVRFYCNLAGMTTFTVYFDCACAWRTMELGPVSQLANNIYRKFVSDNDIASYTSTGPDGAPLRKEATDDARTGK